MAVLEGLDPDRKRILLLFLKESELTDEHKPVVSLVSANLIRADLSEATLSGADLVGVDLSGAILSYANLLYADLSGASLKGAKLRYADLLDADLSEADLSGIDLKGAVGLTDEQIAAAESPEDATMPNGQKYEDWLKNRAGRKEAAEDE